MEAEKSLSILLWCVDDLIHDENDAGYLILKSVAEFGVSV